MIDLRLVNELVTAAVSQAQAGGAAAAGMDDAPPGARGGLRAATPGANLHRTSSPGEPESPGLPSEDVSAVQRTGGWAEGLQEPGPGDAAHVRGEAGSWPEMRFYLGAFCLFFVSYVLVTALMVAGTTALLGYRPVAVTSGSMEPVIRAGDVVMFSDVGGSLLGPGTVVGFDEPGTHRSVTHRVVRTNPDGTYVTQGDANPSVDPQTLEHERVWGVGRILIPHAGYPAAWLAMGATWKVVALAVFLLSCGYGSRWALLAEFDPWRDDG